MSDSEVTTKEEDNPSGGGSATVDSDSFDAEFEDLHKRMAKLSGKKRRETMEKFATMFDVELDKGRGNVKQKALPAQSQSAPYPYLMSNLSTPVHNTIVRDVPKLRHFSGSSKPGPGETTYKQWRRAAMRLLDDREMPRSTVKRVILQSLTGSAEDLIDSSRSCPVEEILVVLDKLYGPTAAGGDLLAAFFQMNQGTEQSASEFLNQLFVSLSEVVERDGIPMGQMLPTLVDQFQRGTHDEDLLNKLRLDEQEFPPQFPDLLSKVRHIESRRTQRRLRHKVLRVRAAQQVELEQETQAKAKTHNSKENEVVQIQQRITRLEEAVKSTVAASTKRAVFCYRCGEDGHIATRCDNSPNESLVNEKMKKRKNQGN